MTWPPVDGARPAPPLAATAGEVPPAGPTRLAHGAGGLGRLLSLVPLQTAPRDSAPTASVTPGAIAPRRAALADGSTPAAALAPAPDSRQAASWLAPADPPTRWHAWPIVDDAAAAARGASSTAVPQPQVNPSSPESLMPPLPAPPRAGHTASPTLPPPAPAVPTPTASAWPRAAPPDLDALLDALAGQLEIEYLRCYGSAS